MGKIWVISRCVMEAGDIKGRSIFTSFGGGQVNPVIPIIHGCAE